MNSQIDNNSLCGHTLPLVKGLRIGSEWNSLSLCWCLSLLLLVMLQAAPKSKGVTHSFAELSSGGLPISRPHPRPPNPQTVSVRAHHSRPTQPTAPPAAKKNSFRKSHQPTSSPSSCHQERHHRFDRRSCSFPMGPTVLHVLSPCDVSDGVGAASACIMPCIHNILRYICLFLTCTSV